VKLGEAQKDTDGPRGFFTDAPQADASGPFYPPRALPELRIQVRSSNGRTLTVDVRNVAGRDPADGSASQGPRHHGILPRGL